MTVDTVDGGAPVAHTYVCVVVTACRTVAGNDVGDASCGSTVTTCWYSVVVCSTDAGTLALPNHSSGVTVRTVDQSDANVSVVGYDVMAGVAVGSSNAQTAVVHEGSAMASTVGVWPDRARRAA